MLVEPAKSQISSYLVKANLNLSFISQQDIKPAQEQYE